MRVGARTEETINLVACREAAEGSKKNGGKEVAIADMMKQTRDKIAARAK